MSPDIPDRSKDRENHLNRQDRRVSVVSGAFTSTVLTRPDMRGHILWQGRFAVANDPWIQSLREGPQAIEGMGSEFARALLYERCLPGPRDGFKRGPASVVLIEDREGSSQREVIITVTDNPIPIR